jgi:Antitoxin MazE-like
MREQGFRMVHIWVPNVDSPDFVKAAHDQSVLAAEFDKMDDTHDWIDAINGENWDNNE